MSATEVSFIKTFLGKLATKPVTFKPDFEPAADEPVPPLPTPSRPFELKYAQTSTALDRGDDMEEDTSYGPLEITVKQMKPSRSFTIRSKGIDTVGHFKTLLAEPSGISVETQRLVFSGKALQDDRTLTSYSLPTGATLHLMLKPAASSASQDSGSAPATEAAPKQEVPPSETKAPTKSLRDRLAEIESKSDLWKAIETALKEHGADEETCKEALGRFHSSLKS